MERVADPPLIELINEKSKPFCSIEFFPPKTDAGVSLLYKHLESLGKIAPLFADVTWVREAVLAVSKHIYAVR